MKTIIKAEATAVKLEKNPRTFAVASLGCNMRDLPCSSNKR